MAKIEISSALINAGMARFIGLNSHIVGSSSDVNARTANLLCGVNNNYSSMTAQGEINIMQGEIPTDFSTLTTYSSRATDVLVKFSTPNWSVDATQYFSMAKTDINPCIINTIYKAATGTGTATWFRWVVASKPNVTAPLDTVIHQIIGTVGLPNANCDLEISDNNIVAGSTYRISSLRLILPTAWTF